eukprot:TRINITY_DN11257_c0_g1_i1.p1 TRINITY_DN11257_c0_g1~~TRINITY_DN11257_c0_g1_i1.p1  ORF type:complete len:799 (+),score=167.39 TRINITY_DN11257_c0_g1_i1:84-2480(+)
MGGGASKDDSAQGNTGQRPQSPKEIEPNTIRVQSSQNGLSRGSRDSRRDPTVSEEVQAYLRHCGLGQRVLPSCRPERRESAGELQEDPESQPPQRAGSSHRLQRSQSRTLLSAPGAATPYHTIAAVLDALSKRVGSRVVLDELAKWQGRSPVQSLAPSMDELPPAAMVAASPAQVPQRPLSMPSANSFYGTDSISEIGVEAPEGEVSFVFTDIADSTALWEQVTDAMNSALSLHNQVLRAALTANLGYEVKTIGDAFMVAFANPVNAVQFCLDVQESLVEQEWPDELNEVASARTVVVDDVCIHRGLRIRMGCHFGEVLKEINPVTRRADYRGPTVNVAARTEGQGIGGLITLTEVMLDRVAADMPVLGNPATRSLGRRQLKGVVDQVHIHAMVPACLEKRLDHHLGRPDAIRTRRLSRWVAASRKVRLQTAPVAGLGALLGVKLARARGTVAVLRPQHPPRTELPPPALAADGRPGSPGPVDAGQLTGDNVLDNICELVLTAEVVAAETDGFLEKCRGDFVLASWNSVRTCTAHLQQAMRFVGNVYRKRGIALGLPPGFGKGFGHAVVNSAAGSFRRVLAGVAHGYMYHGSVGSHRRCHRTAVSPTVTTAFALADFCYPLRTLALLAGRPKADVGMAPYLRTVDRWIVGGELVTVEEVDVGGVIDAEDQFGVWGFLDDAEACGMGGGEAVVSPRRRTIQRDKTFMKYEQVHFRAMGADTDALDYLKSLAAESDDESLTRVAAMLRARERAWPEALRVDGAVLCSVPPGEIVEDIRDPVFYSEFGDMIAVLPKTRKGL